MRLNRIATVVAVAGTLGLGLGACSSSPTGFHNMSSLESSVTQQLNAKMVAQGQQVTVTQDICVSTGANTATCAVQGSDGSGVSVHVVIAADGNSWASS